jgi:hypothetical protein
MDGLFSPIAIERKWEVGNSSQRPGLKETPEVHPKACFEDGSHRLEILIPSPRLLVGMRLRPG